MRNQILEKSKNEFCIAVCEEFGYRLHIWFPPFPEAELEAKWLAAGACGMKGLFDALGGGWFQVFEDPEQSALEQAIYDLYQDLASSGHYTAHICCDQDSHLIARDGRVIVHSGFDWASAKGSDTDPEMIQNRFNSRSTS